MNEIIINYSEKWHWLVKASVTAVIIIVIVSKTGRSCHASLSQFQIKILDII